jgi:hypothetical protein
MVQNPFITIFPAQRKSGSSMFLIRDLSPRRLCQPVTKLESQHTLRTDLVQEYSIVCPLPLPKLSCIETKSCLWSSSNQVFWGSHHEVEAISWRSQNTSILANEWEAKESVSRDR